MSTPLTFQQRVELLDANASRGLAGPEVEDALATYHATEAAIKEVVEEGSTEMPLGDLSGAIDLINTAPIEASI